MAKKKALITGLSGQDGAYLADFLLKKDYEVTGLVLSAEKTQLWRLAYFGIQQKLEIVEGDITNKKIIEDLIEEFQPDEIYNLAGVSSVRQAWNKPAETLAINGLAVINLLEVIQNINSEIKLFQASSANIYGDTVVDEPITEKQHSFCPVDPYGVSKLTAHCSVRNYRDQYGLFCVNGILFNHVSPLHDDFFVFKKIIKGVVEISLGKREIIELGNINVLLDWGFAGDYVEAMWSMLQTKKPEDFIICSGIQHSLKDLLKIAFEKVGVESWERHIKIKESLVRKKDVVQPVASNEKIKNELNWEPQISFANLVQQMIDYENEKSS